MPIALALNTTVGCEKFVISNQYLERQSNEERSRAQTGKDRIERKKTMMAWLCDIDGPLAQTTASTVLGGYRIQVRIRLANTETCILTR